MPIIEPVESITVRTFSDFCRVFSIKTKLKGGDDGFDEELIRDYLEKRDNYKWIINFIDDKCDGYFLIQRL